MLIAVSIQAVVKKLTASAQNIFPHPRLHQLPMSLVKVLLRLNNCPKNCLRLEFYLPTLFFAMGGLLLIGLGLLL